MADFKLVISTKDGFSAQREVKDKDAEILIGKKIGDTVQGDSIGLAGYEFLITGGSDNCGFPMRKDVPGTMRKRILSVGNVVGIRRLPKGIRVRKTVCGNTIHDKIVQINLKVTKEGKEKVTKAKEGAKETIKEEEKKPSS